MTNQSITSSEQLVPVFLGQIGEQTVQVCDARALHSYLGSQRQFADWINQRIAKYGFVENHDFVCVSQICETQRQNGQKGISKRVEYHLTLDMAKELAMVENNAKGREVRRYFIQVEKLALAAIAAQPSFANVAAVVRAWADTARSLAATASSQADIAKTLAEECERRSAILPQQQPDFQHQSIPQPTAKEPLTNHVTLSPEEQFLTGMWDCLGTRHVTAGDIYRMIVARQCPVWTDAAIALFGKLEDWTAKKLVTKLRIWSTQPVPGFTLAAVNQSKHGIVWRLERIS